MSKELEAFEELKRQVGNMPFTSYDNGLGNRTTFLIKDSTIFPLIENALNDNYFYKYIISKICGYMGFDITKHRDLVETENEILNTLVEYENKLKALEIIKDEFEIDFNDKKQTITFQSVDKPYSHIRFSLTRIIKDKEKYDILKEELE